MRTSAVNPPGIEASEPVWDLAYLFPPQGEWSEDDYLSLEANRPVEYTDGAIEVLPMPTTSHQLILSFLFGLLAAYLKERLPGSLAAFASLPALIGPRKYREPDIMVMLAGHLERVHEQYWERPDLVMEIVSSGNRDHDLKKKRREYAQAGIPEYWIVDPQEEIISVLGSPEGGSSYRVGGAYRSGDLARSTLLLGFSVPVQQAWDAARVR